ncbi:MAG: hypothetical protein OES25_07900 [Acidobacteriota bacterium]|nr:hypothetical protein [Acidobacteriota bacterium]
MKRHWTLIAIAALILTLSPSTMVLADDHVGGWGEGGYLFPNKKSEIAVRLATISPDISGASMDETETGIAYSYYLAKHNHKIQADYRQLEYDADPTQDTNEFRVQLQVAF